MNISRIGRYYYLRLIRLKGTPHALALGAALGVYVGITPTIPFHTILIFILTIATRSSFLAGLITSWLICNPITYLPLYYFSTKIGNFVTPYELNWKSIKELLDVLLSDVTLHERLMAFMAMGMESVVVLVVGGCILALPFAVACYYCSYFLFVKIREKRIQKHILH